MLCFDSSCVSIVTSTNLGHNKKSLVSIVFDFIGISFNIITTIIIYLYFTFIQSEQELKKSDAEITKLKTKFGSSACKENVLNWLRDIKNSAKGKYHILSVNVEVS